MSLAQELTSRRDPEALVPSGPAKAAPRRKVAQQHARSSAAEDAVKTAETCAELAEAIGSQIEKRAAQGVDPQVSTLHTTLRKSAHYLREMTEVAEAREKFAASLLDQYEEKARIEEALKIASDLIRDGLVQQPDDLLGYVRQLATQNLEVVKAAAEMAARQDFADLGEPEKFNKKTASSSAPADGDGASWERAHTFLFE